MLRIEIIEMIDLSLLICFISLSGEAGGLREGGFRGQIDALEREKNEKKLYMHIYVHTYS